jgi:hypothetical protein
MPVREVESGKDREYYRKKPRILTALGKEEVVG